APAGQVAGEQAPVDVDVVAAQVQHQTRQVAVDAVEVLAGQQVQALLGGVGVEASLEDRFRERDSQVGALPRFLVRAAAALLGGGRLGGRRAVPLLLGGLRALVSGVSG